MTSKEDPSLTVDRLVHIGLGGDLAVTTNTAVPAPPPTPPSNMELRMDGGFELRMDGGYELRE